MHKAIGCAFPEFLQGLLRHSPALCLGLLVMLGTCSAHRIDVRHASDASWEESAERAVDPAERPPPSWNVFFRFLRSTGPENEHRVSEHLLRATAVPRATSNFQKSLVLIKSLRESDSPPEISLNLRRRSVYLWRRRISPKWKHALWGQVAKCSSFFVRPFPTMEINEELLVSRLRDKAP